MRAMLVCVCHEFVIFSLYFWWIYSRSRRQARICRLSFEVIHILSVVVLKIVINKVKWDFDWNLSVIIVLPFQLVKWIRGDAEDQLNKFSKGADSLRAANQSKAKFDGEFYPLAKVWQYLFDTRQLVVSFVHTRIHAFLQGLIKSKMQTAFSLLTWNFTFCLGYKLCFDWKYLLWLVQVYLTILRGYDRKGARCWVSDNVWCNNSRETMY